MAVEPFAGTEKETHNENANPAAPERLNFCLQKPGASLASSRSRAPTAR
jgi:hypothetical protein